MSGLLVVALKHVVEELDKKIEQRKLVQVMEVKNARDLVRKRKAATISHVQVIEAFISIYVIVIIIVLYYAQAKLSAKCNFQLIASGVNGPLVVAP